MKTTKPKAFYAVLERPKKKVIQLQAYYKRGGRWYKVKKVKGV